MSEIFRVFNNWTRAFSKARAIKADPEKRRKSVWFGVTSVILSIFAAACCALIILFFVWLNSNSFLLIVLGILLGIGVGAFGALILLITAIRNFALQLSINKGGATWAALFFLFASVVACIFIIVFAVGMGS